MSCAFSSPGLYCPESPTPMKELRIDQNIAIVAITNIVNDSPDIKYQSINFGRLVFVTGYHQAKKIKTSYATLNLVARYIMCFILCAWRVSSVWRVVFIEHKPDLDKLYF